MKDRYTYKAKRTDNGGWVQGYLMDENYINTPFNDNDVGGRYDDPAEIDESTISQCTGSKDKNGRLLWENDIVRRVDIRNAGEPSIGVIEYDEENTSFLIHWVDVVNYSATFPWKNKIEVIGNRFDNPKLLEKEEAHDI